MSDAERGCRVTGTCPEKRGQTIILDSDHLLKQPFFFFWKWGGPGTFASVDDPGNGRIGSTFLVPPAIL